MTNKINENANEINKKDEVLFKIISSFFCIIIHFLKY